MTERLELAAWEKSKPFMDLSLPMKLLLLAGIAVAYFVAAKFSLPLATQV